MAGRERKLAVIWITFAGHSRSNARRMPVGDRFVTAEAEHDLGLQRIGILELVDEAVPIAHAERLTHGIVSSNEVARTFHQINKKRGQPHAA
jgi:hypothetical protein